MPWPGAVGFGLDLAATGRQTPLDVLADVTLGLGPGDLG